VKQNDKTYESMLKHNFSDDNATLLLSPLQWYFSSFMY